LQGIISQRYSDAKKVLIYGDPSRGIKGDIDLQDAIEAVAQERDIEGKYKR